MGALETTARGFDDPGPANTNDDRVIDYEYEYDPNETEDFYFTLDLSSHDPNLDFTPTEGPGAVDGPVSVPPTPTRNGEDDSGHAATEGHGVKVQILDLPSNNPLIKLGDKTYSCSWSTDLGSQIYVSAPGLDEHAQYSGRVLDIVSTSRARLIGRPAKVRKRQHDQPAHVPQSSNTVLLDPASRGQGPGAVRSQSMAAVDQQIARFAAVRAQTTDPGHREQASFLERLSIIKQQKGETDVIPFYGVKQYKPPTDFKEIRERALQADPRAARHVARYDSRRRGGASVRKRKISAMQVEEQTEDTPQEDILNDGDEFEAVRSTRAENEGTALVTEQEATDGIDPNLLDHNYQKDETLDPSLVDDPSTSTNDAHDQHERQQSPSDSIYDLT